MALPANLCAGGRSLSEPYQSPDGSAVAFVARDGGGTRLVVASSVAPVAERVVAADPEPAGRGGVVAWLPDGHRLAYVTRTGDIAVVPVAGGPARVVAAGIEDGASSLTASPDGSRLAFVAGTRAVSTVAVGGGPATVVSDGAGFALDPSWSPDGERLAWQEWDVPAMPWDAARVVVARASGDGRPWLVAGGPDVSAQEPRFAPDGSALAFLCDAGGWLNLWLARPDGTRPMPLVIEEHEHGGPVWGGGQRSFAWSPDSRSVAFTRNEGGFGRLCTVGVASGEVRELSRGIHTSLSWAGAAIVCVRSGARTPTAVVAVDPGTGDKRVLATGHAPEVQAAAEWMPEPERVEWPAGDGAVVHGRLWRPPAEATAGGPPPLLVWLHGGPTDQRQVTFDCRLIFYLSRGWAVLHPDPRGSTGWGRAWAQALRGGWGEADVADAAAGAEAAAARGWGDPARMVAMGGSAGGMAALLLAARDPGRWAAVVALYPVCDLVDLAATTHRFEAHYTDGLIGPLPEMTEAYRARSPLSQAGRMTAPVLLLHGSADPVVPPAQSAELAAALRARGVPVERHVYDGESHGWRSAATTQDELERTEAFLDRVGIPGNSRK